MAQASVYVLGGYICFGNDFDGGVFTGTIFPILKALRIGEP